MLGKTVSPLSEPTQHTLCRTHHRDVRQWLEDLEDAGDGAWAVVRGDSSELVVVGDILDPVVINRITDDTNDNEVVSIYEDRGRPTVVIQLCDDIHRSLCSSGQTVLHLQMDAVQTKQRLGLV